MKQFLKKLLVLIIILGVLAVGSRTRPTLVRSTA